jgi:hypothetical protein
MAPTFVNISESKRVAEMIFENKELSCGFSSELWSGAVRSQWSVDRSDVKERNAEAACGYTSPVSSMNFRTGRMGQEGEQNICTGIKDVGGNSRAEGLDTSRVTKANNDSMGACDLLSPPVSACGTR